MKRIAAIALMSLVTSNTLAPMAQNNSSSSLQKYLVPTLKITAGLGGFALTAYCANSILKSADIGTEEFKASYLAPYPTRTPQTVSEKMFMRLAVTYLDNNLILLPFTAVASTYFLVSGVKDAVKAYKQTKKLA